MSMDTYQNSMTDLLKKIARRLTILPLVPFLEDTPYSIDKWADCIRDDTLPTFSRYYPKKISFKVDSISAPKKNGWYHIDMGYFGKTKIIGVGDLDWQAFGNRSLGLAQQFGYGLPDVGMTNFTQADILTLAARSTYASMFNNNVYPKFDPPNRIKLEAVGNPNLNIGDFSIFLYVNHLDDLQSIHPTKMETFERLAISDVAVFLRNLKYWDGIETVLTTTNLNLDTIENQAEERTNVVQHLEDNYVSAGNEAIPFIWTV